MLVLRNVNFCVSRGKNVAIVGPSGSGKSTIISLLERFYEPVTGPIIYQGEELPALNLSQYRAKCSLVSQETHLYHGTVRSNVTIGLADDSDPTSERLIRACRAANIHDFITSLPQGYDTPVGSRGLRLSGGQRQRIAIARALIREPTLLLLDEATSALDAESERLVLEGLWEASKGRTTITVAHRLATVKKADSIIVLEGGDVREQGSHDELLRNRGTY